MIIINHKENKLSIVHELISDEEEKGYLIEAILTAIRWNSLCDDDSKYNKHRIDSTNVFILTELLQNLFNSKVYNKGFTINFKTSSPVQQSKSLYLAIVGAVRWNSLIGVENKGSEDNNNLHAIAVFLEQMAEVKEIN